MHREDCTRLDKAYPKARTEAIKEVARVSKEWKKAKATAKSAKKAKNDDGTQQIKQVQSNTISCWRKNWRL